MGVQMDLVYEGELACRAEHCASEAILRTDAPRDNGGQGASFSPTDLVGAALGACMLTVMGLFARREGIDMQGTRVHVEKEMDLHPRRHISQLSVRISFPSSLRASAVQRKQLEEIALTCPVQQSLHPAMAIPVEFSYAER